MRKLAENIEDAVLPPTMGSVLDEVVGPHVMTMLRSQPDARHVRQPQPAGAREPQSNGVDEAPS
jgi:hypothetical protein